MQPSTPSPIKRSGSSRRAVQQLRYLVRRSARALTRHGPSKALKLAWQAAFQYARAYRRPGSGDASEFDQRTGVDTDDVIHLSELAIPSPNSIYGLRYQATPEHELRAMLPALALRFENYTFLDYGSGKGRALLLASEFPFARIIGVEFSPELHPVAVENIRKYRGADQRCFEIESVCEDAAAYPVPSGPLLCYVYNSFEPPVLKRVLENLQAAAARELRDVYVIYNNAVYASTFAEFPAFREIARDDAGGDGYIIYHLCATIT